METLRNKESTNEKARYFSKFALHHLGEMKILKDGGVLGKENSDWRNVSEHCIAEAVAADILAEHLHADRESLVSAALLHDWFKRKEKEILSVDKKQGTQEANFQSKTLLRDTYGIPERVITISSAVTPDNGDDTYLLARTIEEKIMHYIDAITSGTEFETSPRERILRAIERRPEYAADSETYRTRFGGKSMHELQIELAEQEQEEFERALQITPGTLSTFIMEKLKERIATQS